jgi:CDP-glucose 4,6-dehydratase
VETDPLEGKDPYSASKVGAEAVVSAYQQVSKVDGGPSVVSVRAGNVIGGGDYAVNRLLPDLIRGYLNSKIVQIRNPESTRPWQHVLDPLLGYLLALESAITVKTFGSFNFGPDESEQINVNEVINVFNSSFQFASKRDNVPQFKVVPILKQLEAEKLTLNSSLAHLNFNWINTWSPRIAVRRSAEWWARVLAGTSSPSEEVENDIISFLKATSHAI